MNAVPKHTARPADHWQLDCSVDRQLLVRAADGLSTGDSPALAELLRNRRAFVLTTPTVDAHYGAAVRGLLNACDIEFSWNCLELSEKRKTLATAERVCRAVQTFGLDRRGVLVALGGGVCSDIVTTSAMLVRRGVQHIRIPTTLLGQVDAGIGLKGGVNFGAQKNYLGCFYPPSTALIDVSFLRTLAPARIRQGLAEILKMALIADRSLFETLRRSGTQLVSSRFQEPASLGRWIVGRSIELMLDELQKNPYETRAGGRLADMGHTFSPALETASRYRLTHGEAVAIDMALTCVLAERLGMLATEDSTAFVTLLTKLGLPIFSPLLTRALCEHAISHTVAHRGGRLNMVVPTAIGAGTFVGAEALPAKLLDDAIEEIRTKDESLTWPSRRNSRRSPPAQLPVI